MISARAKEITTKIYAKCGTSSGTLFEIGSGFRSSVEAVVQSVLDIVEEEKN